MRRTLLAIVLLLAGCGGGEPSGGGDGPPEKGLSVSVASYDLGVGVPHRLLVGLQTTDNRYIAGGSVEMSVAFLGEAAATGEPEPFAELTAEFLPLYGEEGPVSPQPAVVSASSGRGVYVARDVEFDRAGFYELTVRVDVADLGVLSGTAATQVAPEPHFPVAGDPAPKTENLVLGSKDAPPEAVDSRAQTGGIPDEELHETVIADAIRQGRPVLIVISTPVYCVSKFCGPVTDLVQELAAGYGDRAEFVHLEVWRDFQKGVINRGAAEWIFDEERQELQEPWVFLVGADGRVVERWDNVATRGEIEPYLEDLPPIE